MKHELKLDVSGLQLPSGATNRRAMSSIRQNEVGASIFNSLFAQLGVSRSHSLGRLLKACV